MSTLISLLFLAVGIVLIVYGVNASNSVASSFSHLFSGAPTDKAIWLLIGGAVIALLGASGLFRGTRSV